MAEGLGTCVVNVGCGRKALTGKHETRDSYRSEFSGWKQSRDRWLGGVMAKHGEEVAKRTQTEATLSSAHVPKCFIGADSVTPGKLLLPSRPFRRNYPSAPLL
ncbi:hypothetical protein EYF80_042689 [Liparis tanakae]|uniref:Uncharacterized protein n=1 Tax=Liparis tanakae TaxID=230148 RepID=A0A4Z2G2K2_9TELE|nr:hypothetical protein EYF80_042689 [Liparis tanakae]